MHPAKLENEESRYNPVHPDSCPNRCCIGRPMIGRRHKMDGHAGTLSIGLSLAACDTGARSAPPNCTAANTA
jgi:hypothetical protein